MTTDRFMTVDEVAEWLAINDRKVMDLARKGELPGFKVGKDWRFLRDEVVAYLNEQRNSARPSNTTNA